MATATLPGTRRVEHIMGMPIVVDVRNEGVDYDVLDHVFDWFRFVDATFSTYEDSSEISRLNRGELTIAHAHPDVREVLVRCEELRFETDGYFDVRAASVDVDPSGLVKGWSIDRAAAILDEAELTDYAVSAGGDMRLRGRAVPESCWRVGIQHLSSATSLRRWSKRPSAPWPRPVPTSGAITCSTRTVGCRRRTCSRSRSSDPTWPAPTPTPPRPSPWAPSARTERPACAATRR